MLKPEYIISLLIIGLILFVIICGNKLAEPQTPSTSEPIIYKFECEKEKFAKFIVDCAAAANPHSDEEGEDLVRECRLAGHSIFCESVKIN